MSLEAAMTIRTINRRLDRIEAAVANANRRMPSATTIALAALSTERLLALEAKLIEKQGTSGTPTLRDVLSAEELRELETELTAASSGAFVPLPSS
jgi:hypothetical protein